MIDKLVLIKKKNKINLTSLKIDKKDLLCLLKNVGKVGTFRLSVCVGLDNTFVFMKISIIIEILLVSNFQFLKFTSNGSFFIDLKYKPKPSNLFFY